MANSSLDKAYFVGITQVVVPVGATVAVYIAPVPAQVGCFVKALLGASCEILPAAKFSSLLNFNLSTTQTAANLATLSGKGWPLHPVGATMVPEIFQIDGPAAFYLSSLGTTSFIALSTLQGEQN